MLLSPARIAGADSGKRAFDKIKVFAKIRGGLFHDGIGAAIAALMGHAPVVAGAVEADAEVGAALVAGITATRQARQSPFPAAFVTMTSWRIHQAILIRLRHFFTWNFTSATAA